MALGVELGLCTVLATPAGRVVQATPGSAALLGVEDGSVQDAVDDVLAVVAQRWPGSCSPAARDLFLPTGSGGNSVGNQGGVVWARLTHWASADRARPGAVSIELRPVRVLAPPGVGLVDDPRVARALGILTDEFADPPGLHALAERCGVSAFHFHRRFVAAVGLSPKRLTLRVQMVHARHRLWTTRAPIAEVAAGCGFAQHGHFSTTFRRLVGLTPRQYRQGMDPPAPARPDKHGRSAPASA
jgi:AraC-like DNA-binding protein